MAEDDTTALHAEIKVHLARIEGEIKTISTKLDMSSDAIRQLIAAGDASNSTAIGYVTIEVARAHSRIDEAEESRERAMESAAAARKELRSDVDELKEWKANLAGRMFMLAGTLTLLIPILTALALKVLGS